MQLVGATRAFIRKPYLWRGIFLGLYGAVIANTILFVAIFVYKNELNGIIDFNDLTVIGAVLISVILLGLLISSLSTFFAVNKFLKMKFDELYY